MGCGRQVGLEQMGSGVVMWLSYQLETEKERESRTHLRVALQETSDAWRAYCSDCGLGMHRHDRYHRSMVIG